MDYKIGSESHMVIRRGRLASNSRGYSSVSLSSDPRNANVYERLLRRKSFEPTSITGSYRRNDLVPSDNEYIERRRKRIQEIQNSASEFYAPQKKETTEKEKKEDKSSSNDITYTRKISEPSLSVQTKSNDNISKAHVQIQLRKQDVISEEEPTDKNKKSNTVRKPEKISDFGNAEEDARSIRRKQWISDRASSTSLLHSFSKMENTDDGDIGKHGSEVDTFIANVSKEKIDTKNVLKLTLDISGGGSDDSDMDTKIPKTKRSTSLYDTKSKPGSNMRKGSTPSSRRSYDLNESLPDLPDTPRTPSNSADRLKRDFGLTDLELVALRGILKKADLYEESVRDRMLQVLKIDEDSEESIEAITNKLMKEREIETMKQKLFMSRKELDSYISFMKKMEREKRQSISEKEELETKIQWHERRLTRFENENKALKKERADLLNQIYELRGKSVVAKESGHSRQKSMDISASGMQQPELEQSKQRLIYEADAFAQERTKLIKERQRLDEEVRKVQIRCVSLLAQLQHSEKTVEDVKTEKDSLKNKLNRQTKQSNEEISQLKEQLAQVQMNMKDQNDNVTTNKKEYSSFMKQMKHDDRRLTVMETEYEELERKYDDLQNEYRHTEETKITLEHENMALKDTINVMQKVHEDLDLQFSEVDAKYRETTSELKNANLASEQYQVERIRLHSELENMSSRMSELQHDVINMEADQDAFKKFLEKLSMELQEKLGEEHVSKDTQADSLEEQSEIIGREIIAHLNPCRKLQDDYEAVKQDRDELEEEIRYLKFALSARLEIQNMQVTPSKCECSKEKETLQRDYDDACKRIDVLEDEVNRLHEDKQQLLMSFLNLQASQRSREVSKSDMALTTDDDISDDDEDHETEDESYHTEQGSSTSTSNRGSFNNVGDDDYLNRCDANELRARLNDVTKTKERLESERIEMLGSLCRQVEDNEALKTEIEDLKKTGNRFETGSRGNSRPGSAISKSESYSSLSSEKCSKCENSSDEIRSYLSIIEELTEDKLRLEKFVADLETDKEKLQCEYERLTEIKSQMEDELDLVGTENDNALKSAKDEANFLIQNMQSLEHENSVLEENLRKLREDKSEILDNLRQAEEDRFGFIRTISLITEQKENVEIELEDLKKEMKELNSRKETKNVLNPSSTFESKDDDIINTDGIFDDHVIIGRTYSMPASALDKKKKQNTDSPREFNLRRVDSVEDVRTDPTDEKDTFDADLFYLKDHISTSQYERLLKTQSTKEKSIPIKKKFSDPGEMRNIPSNITVQQRRVSEQSVLPKVINYSRDSMTTQINIPVNNNTSSVMNDKPGKNKSSSVVGNTPRRKLYNQRQLSYSDMIDLFATKTSREEIPTSSESKGLSFQVSFTGVNVQQPE